MARSLSAIHMAKNRRGLSDDEYRAILALYGLKSSKEIKTDEQFDDVIKAINDGDDNEVKTVYQKRWRCSLAQQRKILVLWRIKGRNQNEEALSAFAKRTAGVTRLEWLDAEHANLVITGLEQMIDIAED